VLVLDPALGDAARSLAPLADALARQGVPRGRLDVIVASCGDPALARECGRLAGRALGLATVHLHDPERDEHYPAGVLHGVAIGVADLLRECEAVIVVTAGGAPAPWRMLVPGLASAPSARALSRSGVDLAAARDAVVALVPVSWALCFAWEGGRERVRAGTPAALWEPRRAP